MISKDIYEDIIENQENGLIILNKKKEIIYINKSARNVYGISNKVLLKNYLKCTYSLKERENCQNIGKCKNCEINNAIDDVLKNNNRRILLKIDLNLNERIMKLSLRIYLAKELVIIEILNLSKDQEKMEYLTKILDHSQDLLFFKDEKLKYRYLNTSFAKLFNSKRDNVYGKTDKELLPEELYHQCLKGDLDTIKKGSYIGIENFNNRYYQVLKEFVDGGILGVAKDITDVLEQKKLAEVDSLTELYNRRKFLEIVDYIYENKINTYYLILIDLDNLRDLNNNYGHIKGDEYLKKLGEILNNYPEGLFFRIGGDEFSGLINRSKNEVEEILKKIYSDLINTEFNPQLSISVGAKNLDISKDYLENYTIVDKLLYAAKLKGKGCYILK